MLAALQRRDLNIGATDAAPMHARPIAAGDSSTNRSMSVSIVAATSCA
jgi:hypothetical protein